MTAELRRLPGVPRVLVAASSGRRARPVVALAGASDWRRAKLDRLAAQLLNAGATRLLPPSRGWDWPVFGVDQVEAMLSDGPVGGRLPEARVIGAVVPRQAGRERLSLLVDSRGANVVVKLGRPDTGIEREAAALRLLTDRPLPGVATPEVIALGGNGAVVFIATTANELVRQHAAIDEPLRTFEADLAERLSTLVRPPGTPRDHVPVHGDLTPWNLRRTPRGLALFDWEAAGWGPAGSDLATYRAACDSLPNWRRRLRRPT